MRMKIALIMLLAERFKFIAGLFIGFLLAPYFFGRMCMRRFRYEDRAQRRILVVPILTRVGDLVCATPVFRAIKMAYPDAHLAVVVSKRNKGIVVHNPRIDELISMNEGDFKGYWGRLRFLLQVGRGNYDWVICLTNNPFNNLIALFSSAPYRVKMIVEERSAAERLTDWVNTYQIVFKNHTFLPGFYLKLLGPLGIRTSEVVKEVFPTPQGKEKVGTFLNEKGVVSGHTLIGFSITAGNRIKEWGDAKFLELIKKIQDSYPQARLVMIGSPADDTRIQTLVAKAASPAVFSATTFTLAELPALVSALDLFIAVDTGTIYVAHALGIPLVDIIGPVDPREQPPSDSKSIQVLPGEGIEPSSFVIKRALAPHLHERALAATTVDMVFAAVKNLLD